MFVRIVDYNPCWPEEFKAEAEKIRHILGRGLIALYHIGSTAVPDLKAKPIIDMLPVVEDLTALDAQAAVFAALGYEAMGEFGLPGRRYYRKGGDNRTHQAHAFQFDNTEEIERHLAFRDYLRAHPAARESYGRLKAELAARFPKDIEGYSDGKHDFVRALEAEALRWHWRNRS